MNIRIVRCLGEADHQLAADAQQESVYGVISTDSDFFICQKTKFIPFHTLNWSTEG